MPRVQHVPTFRPARHAVPLPKGERYDPSQDGGSERPTARNADAEGDGGDGCEWELVGSPEASNYWVLRGALLRRVRPLPWRAKGFLG